MTQPTNTEVPNRWPVATVERFFSYVDATGDCWEWTGGRGTNGYGGFNFVDPATGKHRRRLAHRAAWEILVGLIPPSLVMDHLCRNRACVNPDHLEPVTQRVNNLRGFSLSAANARKTHCKNGHPLMPGNLWKNQNGQRICRACQIERRRQRDRASGIRLRSDVKPCGTPAAYTRHRAAGEKPCDACRLAWNESVRQRRKAS